MELYNDNQNPNHWSARGSRQEDSSQSPYYRQPTHNPYLDEKFAIASICFGVRSMFCNFLFVFPISMPSLGLLFAAMAYRKGKRSSVLLRNGILLSCFGMFVGIGSMISLLRNPQFQAQLAAILNNYIQLYQRMNELSG